MKGKKVSYVNRQNQMQMQSDFLIGVGQAKPNANVHTKKDLLVHTHEINVC